MNTDNAKALAIELMNIHMPDLINQGWYFDWHYKKVSAGTCSYFKKAIQLSKPITELTDEAEVRDTILHEIAHALTPNHGHDWVWRKKALEIGCNGHRCFGNNVKQSTTNAANLLAKYKGICPNGHVTFRNRKPKKKCSCAQCSHRYDERYLITYSLNA